MDGMTQNELSDAEAAEQERQREEDAELVRQAKECYTLGHSATSKWRADAIQDLAFLTGDQWDPNVQGQRQAEGRPALTVNRLPQFVRQITNEQRQSKNSVTVNPVDSGSDVRTAEVLQGVIRNIEYTSNADAAYAKGGESAAQTGLGYWDVTAEYENELSFEQRLSICRISNPMSVVMDPGTKELAGDDARWAVLSSDMSESEWKSKFPGKDLPKSEGWRGEGDGAADWVAKNGVRIHEYRYVKEEPDTLIDDPDGGEPVLASQMAELAAMAVEGDTGLPLPEEEKEKLPERIVVKAKAAGVATRPTVRRKACWAKIAGDEVVERGEFVGRYLQLVRVVGTEVDKGDGETVYEGVIRHARDSQRMLNFFVTAEAEAIALTPKAPFIAAEGQIANHKEQWRTANQKPHSVLEYTPTAIGGTVLPPPQRVMSEANVSAITNARMQAADDLKATTGIYDAALGARSNEQSGRAILARTNQAQTANFHFQDNLAMAFRYTGRILLDLIPKIYSGPRVMRILGEDGKPEMVPVNGAQPPAGYKGDANKPIQLDAGRYDVAVTMGPSYTSRRQEAAAQLLELTRVNPGITQVAGDLIVKSMDIPGGNEIAKRLQALLPPEIRPPAENQAPQQMLAQQAAESQQFIERLTQELNATSQELQKEKEGNATKERIELTKLHVHLLETIATLESKEHVAALAQEASLLGKRLGLVGFAEPAQEPQPAPQQFAPPQPQGAVNGQY